MAVDIDHRTKTQVALEAIREAIHSGAIQPGQRILVNELTTELGMSQTPIREALRLLQADRLVEFQPHRGVIVTPVRPAEAAEVTRIRSVAEGLAVEMAAEKMSTETLAAIEALHAKAVMAVAHHASALSQLNADWHWAIYMQCDAVYLIDFIRRLWDVVPWRTVWALQGRSQQSIEHHKLVMEAIESRDAPLAGERMREHILSGID